MTPPRTLALFATDFPPALGGIQTLTAAVYRRLADITAVAVAPALPPGLPEPVSGLPLVRTRRSGGAGLAQLAYLREAARTLRRQRSGPLLLHCNHLFAGFAARWLCRPLPYLVWIHGEELTKCRYPALARAALRRASAILVNSAFTAARVRDALGPQNIPPIHKIPLGVEPSRILPAPLPPPAPRSVPVILTLARLSARDRYKGLDTALRAMAELRRRGRAFRYRIAGAGDDRAYLESLARELGLGSEVEFLGPVSDEVRLRLLDECDLFLLASREQPTPRGLGFEGFGIVFLEANARGKPVVGGRSGGVPDAVLDGETGLLADPADPSALAAALERLLLDPALRHRLGEAGRLRVAREYNWDEAARRVRALHQSLLGRPL